jgi:5-methylcytosine-specific restriction endonuclease McrA
MQKYKEIYLKGMNYTDTDFIESEISGLRAADLHHIVGRGRGGKDILENLMALTREEHLKYGDKKQFMHFLFKKHYNFLIKKKVKFNVEFFIDMFDKYFVKSTI